MKTALRLLGLACIAAVTVALSLADLATLAALAAGALVGAGIVGFGLCVLAGQIAPEDREGGK